MEEDFFKEIKCNEIRYGHTKELTPEISSHYKHSHYRYELYLFIDGSADFFVEERKYVLKPHTAILIKPSIYHYVNIKSLDVPYHRVTVNFCREAVYPEIFSLLDSNNEFFLLSDNSCIFDSIKKLEADADMFSAADNAIMLKFFLNETLLRLKYAKGDSIKTALIVNPTLSKILKYINEHIYDNLDIETLSQNLYLSKTYISYIVSTHLKISVMDYIKQKKIYLARSMILDGMRPTDAASKCGFDNYSTFYRLYKKYLKHNPTEENTKKFL